MVHNSLFDWRAACKAAVNTRGSYWGPRPPTKNSVTVKPIKNTQILRSPEQ